MHRTRTGEKGQVREWIQTAMQLKQRSELLEKDHHSWLHSKRSWFDPHSEELSLLADLDKQALDASTRLHRERTALRSEVRRLHDLVQRFQLHLSSPQDSEGYVEQLRELVQQIEEALANFKTTQKEKYVKLSLEERDLWNETQSLQAGFERWSEQDALPPPTAATAAAGGGTPAKKRTKAAHQAVPLLSFEGIMAAESAQPTAASSSSSLPSAAHTAHASASSLLPSSASPSEIRELIDRLDATIASEGGMYGGWDPRDHQHFLKLHTQLSSSPAVLCARLVNEVANLTASEAMEHMEWYARYRRMLAEKKALIARWKESKELSARQVDEAARALEEKAELERQEAQKAKEAADRERAAKAAAVAEWREKKRVEKESLEARRRAEAEEQARLQREKQEEERRRLRSLVEAYQEEKAVEQLVEQIQQQPTQRELSETSRTERDARRRLLQKQEETLRALAEKRAAKQREKEREEERKKQLLQASTPTIQVARDPSRLTQATAALVARAKQREAEEAEAAEYARTHGGKTPSTLLSRPAMGARATPGWRKGI